MRPVPIAPLLLLWPLLTGMPAATGRAAAPSGTAGTVARGAVEAQAVLDRHCLKCHGPLEQKAGLELDTLAGALKGGEDGPVVVPGRPAESKLVSVLDAAADPHMPPRKQLTDAEIGQVRFWIEHLGVAEPAEAPRAVVRELPPAGLDPVVAIDRLLAADWEARKQVPAPECDDATFLRRVTLNLVGRLPQWTDVQTFVADPAPRAEKRMREVDRLLASPEFAVCQRETWDVILMERHAGRREQRRRDHGWFAFLEGAFRENRPWDEVIRALATARPSQPADRGAQWFVYERNNDHQKIAEALAPVIYGTRMDCAQCHDHPLAREIKQAHYWGLVAAFNRSKNAEGGDGVVGESAVGGFANFTNLKKESQPALLTLLHGPTVPEIRPAGDTKFPDLPEGYLEVTTAASNAKGTVTVKVPRYSRRAAVAEAVTGDNPLLARSLVNYTWAILMGRGLVHPVDEMNSKHPPSHPALLDWLARDVAGHRYEVRRLVRSVVLSRAYQLAPYGGDPASAPPAEAFAAAAERTMPAETLARAARIAAGRSPDDDALRREFAEAFPEVLPRVTRSTIQQAMFLANNERLASLFQPETGGELERIAAIPAVGDRVVAVFRRALIREPDAAERERGAEFLTRHPGPPAAAVGQLMWALVTGPEFLTNH